MQVKTSILSGDWTWLKDLAAEGNSKPDDLAMRVVRALVLWSTQARDLDELKHRLLIATRASCSASESRSIVFFPQWWVLSAGSRARPIYEERTGWGPGMEWPRYTLPKWGKKPRKSAILQDNTTTWNWAHDDPPFSWETTETRSRMLFLEHGQEPWYIIECRAW